jgi:hypothetical protein
MKKLIIASCLLLFTINLFAQAMNESKIEIYIPAEKAEMRVLVKAETISGNSMLAGVFERELNGFAVKLTVGDQQGKLKVFYQSSGGAADAEFDYFNPYFEGSVLYCEMTEYVFVKLTYLKDGQEISRQGLLQSDTYFYEKQP